MQRIGFTLMILLGTLSTVQAAVPKKVLNACKSLASVVTYGNDGKMISTSVAFTLGEKGECVSEYTAFHNARSAEYIDESGKKQKVSRINGASDIYDVIKFSLDTKSKEFLAVAKAASPQGSAVYILRKGSAKKPEAVASKINVKSILFWCAPLLAHR